MEYLIAQLQLKMKIIFKDGQESLHFWTEC